MVDENELAKAWHALAQRPPIDLDPVEIEQMMQTWMGLVPGRPEIPTAIIGAILAAPLRPERPGHLGIVGAPGVGKSPLLAAAKAWVEPVDPRASVGDLSFRSSTFAQAAARLQRRLVAGVCFADDVVLETNRAARRFLRFLDMAAQERTTVVFAGEVHALRREVAQHSLLLEIQDGDLQRAEPQPSVA